MASRTVRNRNQIVVFLFLGIPAAILAVAMYFTPAAMGIAPPYNLYFALAFAAAACISLARAAYILRRVLNGQPVANPSREPPG